MPLPQKKHHICNNKSISFSQHCFYQSISHQPLRPPTCHTFTSTPYQKFTNKNPSLSATKVGVQLVPLPNNKLNIDSSRPPGSRNMMRSVVELPTTLKDRGIGQVATVEMCGHADPWKTYGSSNAWHARMTSTYTPYQAAPTWKGL